MREFLAGGGQTRAVELTLGELLGKLVG